MSIAEIYVSLLKHKNKLGTFKIPNVSHFISGGGGFQVVCVVTMRSVVTETGNSHNPLQLRLKRICHHR